MFYHHYRQGTVSHQGHKKLRDLRACVHVCETVCCAGICQCECINCVWQILHYCPGCFTCMLILFDSIWHLQKTSVKPTAIVSVLFVFCFCLFVFCLKRREEKRNDDLSHYCWQWRHPSQSNSLQLGTNSLLVSQAYHRHINFQCLISVFCIFLLWNTAVYCWVLDRREDKRMLKKLRMTNECYVCYSSQTQTILVSDNFIH